jgi:hypothetical protein
VTKWTAPLKTSSEELNASNNFSVQNQTVSRFFDQPLRRFIMPITLLLGFSVKPFQKRLAKRLTVPNIYLLKARRSLHGRPVFRIGQGGDESCQLPRRLSLLILHGYFYFTV